MEKQRIPHCGDAIAELFDHLPMLVFYVKNEDGVFIRCNRRFEEFHGLEPGGAIGLSDYDLHSVEIADRYRAEDRQVMDSGEPTPNRTWMVPGAKGVLRWWVSRKTPLRDEAGTIRGIAGVMYEISSAAGVTEPFARIEPALNLIHGEISKIPTTAQLAKACNYSESQFNRLFRRIMGRSPRRYILGHRLETAKDLLARTDLPLAVVAEQAGFYDSSDFGKRFREETGITPRQYRMRLQETVNTRESGSAAR